MDSVFNISVFEHLGSSLNSILENKCAFIEMDFSSVDFMSRSFADQFHKERIKLQNDNNIVIEVVNASEEVINILRTVSRTQSKSEREINDVQIFSFSNLELLKDHLLSI
jgi:hypothetical protein